MLLWYENPPIVILNQTTTYERMSDSYLSETKITGDNFLDFKNKMIVSPTHTCIYQSCSGNKPYIFGFLWANIIYYTSLVNIIF